MESVEPRKDKIKFPMTLKKLDWESFGYFFAFMPLQIFFNNSAKSWQADVFVCFFGLKEILTFWDDRSYLQLI